MKPYIYKLTDTRNGKIYIGQHNGKTKSYFTGGVIPKDRIKKYGKEVFKREIIVQGDFNQELLNQLEIHYVRLFASNLKKIGYNLTEGGGGSLGAISWNKGKKRSEEAKKKALITQRKNIELERLKTCKPILKFDSCGRRVGRFKTASATNDPVASKNALGTTAITRGGYIYIYESDFSKEFLLEKIRLSKIPRVAPPIRKKILQYSLNGSFIKEWESIDQAKEVFGSGIQSCLSNMNRTCKGFLFFYKGDFDEEILIKRVSFLKERDFRVAQISIEDNKILKIWESPALASKSLKTSKIVDVCNGKRNKTVGYKWKYVKNITNKELENKYIDGVK